MKLTLLQQFLNYMYFQLKYIGFVYKLLTTHTYISMPKLYSTGRVLCASDTRSPTTMNNKQEHISFCRIFGDSSQRISMKLLVNIWL